jgi:hypothetical protein
LLSNGKPFNAIISISYPKVMDVYHKVLTKIYEETGGRDSVDVDLVDLTRREGFFPSLSGIAKQLSSEGWISETPKQYTVRITHWGVAEAKRVLADAPDKNQEIGKESTRMLNSARELVIMLEEFAAKPESDKFQVLENKVAGLTNHLSKIKSNL